VVSAIKQPATATRFAFERGCRLKLKVIKAEGK
jgi:hypothetical protein